MPARVLGRRVPWKTFVAVPVVFAAHKCVNQVEPSLLPGIRVPSMRAEAISGNPRGREVFLGGLLKPVGLPDNDPTTWRDYAGEGVKRPRVATEHPTGADAGCQSEAARRFRPKVRAVHLTENDLSPRRSHLQLPLSCVSAVEREVNPGSADGVRFSSA